jgi:hypothetical protein
MTCDARGPTPHGYALKRGFRLTSSGVAQFWRVEIRHPDLNPCRRVRASANAEGIPVADVADLAGEGFALARQRGFAGVSLG